MSQQSNRPAWFTRRNIRPFTLEDAEVKEIIANATHGVVSWVTADSKPVTAVMLYVLIDDLITMTSTTNRAKYHAWRRNPAASFTVWEPNNIGRQVTLRGHVEMRQDADLLRRFTEIFLTRRNAGKPPSEEQLVAEIGKFNAPDRHMIQLQVDKVLTHDLFRLFRAETEGTDVWGDDHGTESA